MLILFLKRCKFSDFWKQNQRNEGNLLKIVQKTKKNLDK